MSYQVSYYIIPRQASYLQEAGIDGTTAVHRWYYHCASSLLVIASVPRQFGASSKLLHYGVPSSDFLFFLWPCAAYIITKPTINVSLIEGGSLVASKHRITAKLPDIYLVPAPSAVEAPVDAVSGPVRCARPNIMLFFQLSQRAPGISPL